MTPMMRLLQRLSHPTVWEDIVPGALFAMPKVAHRVSLVLATGHFVI